MRRTSSCSAALVALWVLVAAGCGDEAGGKPTGEPDKPPEKFTTKIDNAWFPLKPGTTFISEGTEDGEAVRDVVRVTHRTKLIDGVRCRVIDDRNYKRGRLVEQTNDYYVQDSHGNVWYFGEDTATVQDGKIKSREGTWRAGVKGARAGLFMPRSPRVGERHYQEWYVGHAEDEYVVETLHARTGRYRGVLRTREFTRLEPGAIDFKFYARGVGQVAERSKDGSETLKLVRVVRP